MVSFYFRYVSSLFFYPVIRSITQQPFTLKVGFFFFSTFLFHLTESWNRDFNFNLDNAHSKPNQHASTVRRTSYGKSYTKWLIKELIHGQWAQNISIFLFHSSIIFVIEISKPVSFFFFFFFILFLNVVVECLKQ